jgi:hypothetical protein
MNTFPLMLSGQEKTYLMGLLDTDLRETRVEVRRADTPQSHDALLEREQLIRGLIEKLGGANVAGPTP